ncbi:LCP family protein [Janibacter melonis]|uniref:LCP family protein n=1 Tax=Janibacter melonis TaxID=262209 RepID=UPI002095D33E|nr:LCP family protein [Janibacter melonis]
MWTLGEDNAALFPGDPSPGLTVTKDAVSQILGLDIDYTTIIDLKGFTELVDAMGGVQIDVKERVCIGCKVEGGVVVGTTGYIEPGVQRLDGYRALWYSRSRADSRDGDFSRMRRQRCMVGALINQVNPVSMLRRYPELAAVLKKNVAVDIPRTTCRPGRSSSSGSRTAARSSRCP